MQTDKAVQNEYSAVLSTIFNYFLNSKNINYFILIKFKMIGKK